MLSDRFFEEYAKTGKPKPAETDDALDDPEKDSYTRAEVAEIVNAKVKDAVDSMKEELNALYGAKDTVNEPDETPAE